MKFAIIATCKKVQGQNRVLVEEDTKVVVCNAEWANHTCSFIYPGEPMPEDVKLFSTRQEAVDFASYLDSDEAKANKSWWATWYPWYIQSKSWEVVEVPTAEDYYVLRDTRKNRLRAQIIRAAVTSIMYGEKGKTTDDFCEILSKLADEMEKEG